MRVSSRSTVMPPFSGVSDPAIHDTPSPVRSTLAAAKEMLAMEERSEKAEKRKKFAHLNSMSTTAGGARGAGYAAPAGHSGVPTHRKPLLDQLIEHKDRGDSNVVGGSLRDWMASQSREQATFQSAAVAQEIKLKKAKAFAKELGRPNIFLTAVAFDVLEAIGGAFGQHTALLKQIRDVLREATYVDVDGLRAHLKEWAADPDGAGSRERIEIYYESAPYFQRYREMEAEIAKLKARVNELERDLSDQTRDAARELAAERARSTAQITEHQVAQQAVAADLHAQLRTAKKELEDFKEDRANADPHSEILRLLHGMGMAQREPTIVDCLEQSPASWGAVATHLLQETPVATSLLIIRTVLTTRKDMRFEDFLELFIGVLDSDALGDEDDKVRQRLLVSIVRNADKDRGACVLAMMDMLNTREKHALVRYLCGFDSEINWMYVSRVVHQLAAPAGARPRTLSTEDVEREKAQQVAAEEHALVGKRSIADAAPGAKVPGDSSVRSCEQVLASLDSAETAGLVSRAFASMSPDETYDIWVVAGCLRFREFDEDRQAELLALLLSQASDGAKKTVQVMTGTPPPEDVSRKGGGARRERTKSEQAAEEAAAAEMLARESSHGGAGGAGGGAGVGGAGGVGGGRHGRKKKALSMPLSQFLRPPPKGIEKPKMKMSTVLELVHDLYHKKMVADEVDDREHVHRQPLAEFLRDFLLHRYGLPSVVEGYLYAIVEVLVRDGRHHQRLRMLCICLGLLSEDKYNPRFTDVMLHLLKQLFPKFSPSTMRTRRVGFFIVRLEDALEAMNHVFPVEALTFSIDKLQLTDGRRKKLWEEVRAEAVRYSDFAQEARSLIEEARAVGDDDGLPPMSGLSAVAAITGTFREDARVVDVDDLLEICMKTWWEQVAHDAAQMKAVYHDFDSDGNGVLSFTEFKAIIAACCPDEVSLRDQMRMFKEVSSLDGPFSGDAVSAVAFAALCAKYGITPPSDGATS